ncbi:MAG: HNH endonuclease [Nitrosomonas sp.]|nr:MAG: HNH endonuclease [Nitrosomonas sp.]
MKSDELERFWAKVDRQEDHWLWLGAKCGNTESLHIKYGTFWNGSKNLKAHRYSYELAHGPIPKGWTVDHLCHVTLCVNPDHLRLANPKEQAENRSGPRKDSSSGIRGVSWHKKRQRWVAQVKHNYKNYYAGEYRTREEAAIAVRDKRNELFTANHLDRDEH